MNKEDQVNKSVNNSRPVKKKKNSILGKLLLTLAFISAAAGISYYSLIEHQLQKKLAKKITIEKAILDHQENNIETEIFDLKQDEAVLVNIDKKIAVAGKTEIHEIKERLTEVEKRILQYSHNSNLLFLYLKIRDELFSAANKASLLQDFEQAVSQDKFLSKRVKALEDLISTNLKPSSLEKDLKSAVPDLIAIKNIEIDSDPSWIDQLKHRFRKLITIRKIDQKPNNQDFEIDFIIADLESNISQENYQRATQIIDHMPKKYQNFLLRLQSHMQVIIEIKQIDQEIINYLLKN